MLLIIGHHGSAQRLIGHAHRATHEPTKSNRGHTSNNFVAEFIGPQSVLTLLLRQREVDKGRGRERKLRSETDFARSWPSGSLACIA